MKHTIAIGTDGATICAFDPAALPADFDAMVADDPVGLMQKLQSEGRFWFAETGGDGRFVLQVSFDEPAALMQENGVMRRLICELPAFACPSGKLWFCGAEYAANNPGKGSAFTPKGGLRANKMGAQISVPTGAHRMEIYRHEHVAGRAGAEAQGSRLLNYTSGALCIAGLMAAAFGLVIFAVGAPVKLYHYLSGNSLADKGWHLFPIALAALAAGAAVFWTGLQFGHWHRRNEDVSDNTQEPGGRPNFEINIRTQANSHDPSDR